MLDDVSLLPQASVRETLESPRSGYLTHMDAQLIGEASAVLGAGRQTKTDPIDYAAGIVLRKKTGAYVRQGEPLAVLHTNRPGALPEAKAAFLRALSWGDQAPQAQPLIYGIVK